MTTASIYRLPGNVLPTKYSLTLTPNLTDFTFSGNETIDIMVTETTNRIAVNAIDLEIADVEITLEDGTSLTARDIALDEKLETATFTFERDIPTDGWLAGIQLATQDATLTAGKSVRAADTVTGMKVSVRGEDLVKVHTDFLTCQLGFGNMFEDAEGPFRACLPLL